jgi:uncharacterized membrane protein
VAAAAADPPFDDVRQLVTTFCLDCHAGDEPQAGLNLDRFHDRQGVVKHPETWSKVLSRVRNGEMPPADSGYELTAGERGRLADWVQGALREAVEQAEPWPGTDSPPESLRV